MNTKIYAHRGFSAKYPENTMIAFRKAQEAHVDGIELDIQLTQDEKLIVMHDETLDRTTNGNGLIRHTNSSLIRQLSAGAWFDQDFVSEQVPFLEEVLDWIKDTDIELNIEIKGDPRDREKAVSQLLALLNSFDLKDQVVVSSFDHMALKLLREADLNVEIAALTLGMLADTSQYLATHQFEGIHCHYSGVTEEDVQFLHERKQAIRLYTVNDQDILLSLCDIGADAVMTDDPLLALFARNHSQKK
ncbi:glycerophosphodiester phosphodiesterase [Paenalkalicoccus suaedae]|uniref:Glycerophosphodiester phosphodiesterase n=1 Tax=Paenalkalicoccus suaedae TaxID=2592382 RepID=A0A859FCX9_9BACI|nr:glycerophosphodiester phosphodiesterase [Paenalkalicoccus suaedae]QKS70076.1 glycerophosphodiester phosphodiesterase [Paenalkalicoccus suaedae]